MSNLYNKHDNVVYNISAAPDKLNQPRSHTGSSQYPPPNPHSTNNYHTPN